MEATKIVQDFWNKLLKSCGSENVWKMFTIPQRTGKNEGIYIYAMTTLDVFIFDDAFWDLFYQYPFHICHVSWENHELCFRVEDKEKS